MGCYAGLAVCRASLLFLHVQSSNTPAHQLYDKEGFKAAAVLPGYYSQQLAQRGHLGWQQQQQQEFSGSDAELLVLQLDNIVVQAASESTSSSSDAFTGPGSSTAWSSDVDQLLSSGAPDGSWLGVDSSEESQQQPPHQPLPGSFLQNAECLQGAGSTHSSAPAKSSSSSSSNSRQPAAAETATEAVTAAAAAAARLLLGPAVGLLGGLFGASRGGRARAGAQAGPSSELVRVGDEWMVQVRQSGGEVVLYDPDELPDNVVLSDRDKSLLQRQQRQRQQGTAAVARADDDDGDDDGHGSLGGGSTGSSEPGAHQKQQQPAGVAAPPSALQNISVLQSQQEQQQTDVQWPSLQRHQSLPKQLQRQQLPWWPPLLLDKQQLQQQQLPLQQRCWQGEQQQRVMWQQVLLPLQPPGSRRMVLQVHQHVSAAIAATVTKLGVMHRQLLQLGHSPCSSNHGSRHQLLSSRRHGVGVHTRAMHRVAVCPVRMGWSGC